MQNVRDQSVQTAGPNGERTVELGFKFWGPHALRGTQQTPAEFGEQEERLAHIGLNEGQDLGGGENTTIR
jgi:hypothetical protein